MWEIASLEDPAGERGARLMLLWSASTKQEMLILLYPQDSATNKVNGSGGRGDTVLADFFYSIHRSTLIQPASTPCSRYCLIPLIRIHTPGPFRLHSRTSKPFEEENCVQPHLPILNRPAALPVFPSLFHHKLNLGSRDANSEKYQRISIRNETIR